MSASRYEPRRVCLEPSAPWGVWDTVEHRIISNAGTWSQAQTWSGEKNREDKQKAQPQPAAQRCNCPTERYRRALAQIARFSGCPYALKLADEALNHTGEE